MVRKDGSMRVVIAPDKFRGSAAADEVVTAACRGASSAGWECDGIALADGGEGMLAAFGGPNRESTVTGPLGDPVSAGWRLDNKTAVVEMAQASGLDLVEENDPMAATTYGTGELIEQAVQRGASRVIVGLGGSATTDGGLGALRALHPAQRLRGVDMVVACDVTTRFVDAAQIFGPQKGATPAQVELLRRRLERLVQMYIEDHEVDVSALPGAGAAGGLAGGLAAIGARLVPGFELIADELGLAELVEGADLVITGEGLVDDQSFRGKVVGGVIEIAEELGVPVVIVCGAAEVEAPGDVKLVSISETYGDERSWNDTLACIEDAVATELRARRA